MLGDSPALSPDLGSNSELCLLLASWILDKSLNLPGPQVSHL